MSEEKKIDRKAFLATTVAALATVSLGACSDDGEGGGTDDGGGATGGSSTGGSSTGGTSTGGTSTGGTGGGVSATGGSATGGSATGGGAGMSGGSGGSGGGGEMYVCTADTNNGTHSHPLTIPGADIDRGMQDAPYILEDGGTGHTHTLELAVYEFAYLKGGTPWTVTSSMDAGHSHSFVVTCVVD